MEEGSFLTAFIITLLAGGATSIGAALSFVVRRGDFKIFALGLSFSAGVMIYVSFMDILPMSIEHMQNGGIDGGFGPKLGYALALSMFFVGMLCAALIDYLVPEHASHEMADERDDRLKSNADRQSRVGRAGLITAIALAIHNFPEGLSVFVTSMENLGAGVAVGVAILLHNIPEGVSVSLPIYNATGSRSRAFWAGTFSGLAEPLGAVCAYFLLSPIITPVSIGALLAITGGIMVYISLDELLPMAREYGEPHYGVLGAAFGMGVMALSSVLFI